MCFFVNEPATTCIYTYCPARSLHAALPIFFIIPDLAPACHFTPPPLGAPARHRSPCSASFRVSGPAPFRRARQPKGLARGMDHPRHRRLHRNLLRSEENTSELQSLMRISYAVLCLKKKKNSLL